MHSSELHEQLKDVPRVNYSFEELNEIFYKLILIKFMH